MSPVKHQLKDFCVMKAWPHSQVSHNLFETFEELIRIHVTPNVKFTCDTQSTREARAFGGVRCNGLLEIFDEFNHRFLR